MYLMNKRREKPPTTKNGPFANTEYLELNHFLIALPRTSHELKSRYEHIFNHE